MKKITALIIFIAFTIIFSFSLSFAKENENNKHKTLIAAKNNSGQIFMAKKDKDNNNGNKNGNNNGNNNNNNNKDKDKDKDKVIILKPKKPKKDKIIIIKDKPNPPTKVIVVAGSSPGSTPAEREKMMNWTVYGGLTSSILHLKSSGSSGGMTLDAGTRYGLGTSLGLFLNRHVEIELGYTYYANEAVFESSPSDKINVGSYPVYLNFVFHPRAWRLPHMYFGGGINYSFFSMHYTDGTYDYKPCSGLGFQIVNGIDTRFTRWEWGIMWTNGKTTPPGTDMDISLDGFYFKGGFKII